ncbi:MAG: iron-containing alcohol dehydrogenase [Clostridiales Family XIII bacterium]|nr:iron-containing alcohol dehydrogenase [Clostridiales Family XIII bacterium]
MNPFDFTMPTKFYVGAGRLGVLEEIAPAYGRKAMICAAKDTMRALGFTDRVGALLKAAGVDFSIVDDVEPNPRDVDIDRQTERFVAENCDFTIGLGGGSALDTAKAIAFLAAQDDRSVRSYIAGGSKADLEKVNRPFPVICIATTAGTGSEATKWFVVTDTRSHDKPGVGHDLLMPSASIVDPELMLSMPPSVTRSCGIDVLFHAMEAYVAKCANPFTDILAEASLRLVMRYLDRAIRHGDTDIEARANMAWASMLGGVVIGEGNSGTVAIHALGHSVGGQTGAPHGLTMCPFAVPYLEKTWRADIRRHAELTRIFGGDEGGLSEEALAARSPAAMKRVLQQFDCDVRMRDLGVTEAMIEPMTDSVFSTMAGVLNNSLVSFERRDVTELFRAAM